MQEVIARAPQLLMDAGDPGTFPLEARIETLDAMIARIEHDDLVDLPDHDAVRRFAKPDMAPYVSDRWSRHNNSPSVRTLLTLLIWLGELGDCADVANACAFGGFNDRDSQVFAGRAVSKVGSDADKRRYVSYLVENAAKVPALIVRDALDCSSRRTYQSLS